VAAFGLLARVARPATFPRGDGYRRRKAPWLIFLRYERHPVTLMADSKPTGRAGTASRVVLIKLPRSETAPQHTIVIEELSAWA
jgi:hypothetical protein